jgi:hypothetical protein
MYTVSRIDPKNILQWLRGGDESQWDERTRLLSETISKLQDLVHPPHRDVTGGPSAESDSFSPEAAAISVATASLMKMLAAMHGHNRAKALEHGEAAMELLPEG